MSVQLWTFLADQVSVVSLPCRTLGCVAISISTGSGQEELEGVSAEHEPSHCTEPALLILQELGTELQEVPIVGAHDAVTVTVIVPVTLPPGPVQVTA